MPYVVTRRVLPRGVILPSRTRVPPKPRDTATLCGLFTMGVGGPLPRRAGAFRGTGRDRERRRPMPLRRSEVIAAALLLLDEVGLDALSTRRLAARLDVHAGALYWHVASKHDLLDAIADKIL